MKLFLQGKSYMFVGDTQHLLLAQADATRISSRTPN